MAPVNMHHIRNSINDWMSRSEPRSAPTPLHPTREAPETQTIYREVQSGQSIVLDGYYELNPNHCGALSAPRVSVRIQYYPALRIEFYPGAIAPLGQRRLWISLPYLA